MADEPNFKYYAFISYSHQDSRWGNWLHKGLETYRVPKRLVGQPSRAGETVPARIMPVFRDREELPTATNLGEIIDAALRQSRYLVVICSPRSAKSQWVNQEILNYKRLGRSDRILALIVDGEPNAQSKPHLGLEECFPEALKYELGDDGELSSLQTEPIAADAREGKDGKLDAKLKLIAGVLGVGFDQLKQRDLQRRQRRMATIAAAAVALMLVMAALTVWAFFERTEAQRQRREAQAQRTEAQQQRDEAQRQRTEAERQRDLAASRLARFYVDRGKTLARADRTGQLLMLANALAVDAPDRDARVDALRIHPLLDPYILPASLHTHADPVTRLHLSTQHMVAAHPTGSYQVTDAKTAAVITKGILPEEIRGTAFSPDGKSAVVYSRFHAHIVNLSNAQEAPKSIKIMDTIKLDPKAITYAPDLHIDDVPFSSDGKLLVLESNQHMRAFELASGNSIWQLPVKEEDKWGQMISGPGNQLFHIKKGEGEAHTIDVLHFETGKAAGPALTPPKGLTRLLPSPDGARLVMLHQPDEDHVQAQVLTLEDRKTLTTGSIAAKDVGPTLFIRDDVLLISFEEGVADGSVTHALDLNTGKLTQLDADKEWRKEMAALSPDGTRLALLDSFKVAIIDVAKLTAIKTISLDDLQGNRCAFSPDGRLLLIADNDRAQVFDVASGAPASGFFRTPMDITRAGFDANDMVYLNCELGQLRFPVTPVDTPALESHDIGSQLTQLHVDDAGRFLALTQKNELIVGDPKTRQTIDMIALEGVYPLGDSNRIHIQGAVEQQVMDLKTGKLLAPMLEKDPALYHAAFHRATGLIATVDNRLEKSRSLHVIQIDDPASPVGEWTGQREFGTPAFAPDGSQIAIYEWPLDDQPAQLSICSLPGGQELCKTPVAGASGRIAFADAGRRVILQHAKPDGITILDSATGQTIGRTIAFRPFHDSMVLSAGGELMILYDSSSRSAVPRVRSYQTRDAAEAGPIISLDQPIKRLSISPTNNLVWISTAKYCRVWRIDDAQPTTGQLEPGCAAWSTGGRLIAIGDTRGRARLIDALTGEVVWTHDGPGAVTAIALDNNLHRIAFAEGSRWNSKTGKVHLMELRSDPLNPARLLTQARIISGRQLDQGLALQPLSRQVLRDAIKTLTTP